MQSLRGKSRPTVPTSIHRPNLPHLKSSPQSLRSKPTPHSRVQTIPVDLEQSRSRKAKQILESEHSLLRQAGEFVDRIKREKMRRRGLFVVLKQQQQQQRRLREQIREIHRRSLEEVMRAEKLAKVSEQIRQHEANIKQRGQQKERFRQNNRSIGPMSALSQQHKELPVHSQIKKEKRKKGSSSVQLSNQVYLRGKQKQVEQARKLLLQLQSAITTLEQLRYRT